MRRLGCFVLLSALCVISLSAKTTCVFNQKQFDEAVRLINQGQEMQLLLHKGTYRLTTPIDAQAPLYVIGKNAVITCSIEISPNDLIATTNTHDVYRLKMPLPPYSLFYSNSGDLLKVSESVQNKEGVNFVEDAIVAPEEFNSGTRIKIPISSNLSHLKNKRFEQSFGYVDCGWTIIDFYLEKSDDDYFYCKTASNCTPRNYMYDKKAYSKRVRFVIYNAEICENSVYYDSDKLYVPKGTKDVCVVYNGGGNYELPKMSFNSDIVIKGISFVGITSITVNSKKNSICDIRNSRFYNTTGTTLTINKENGTNVEKATISNCIFGRCSLHTGTAVFLSSNWLGQSCIEMKGCRLSRYPDGSVGYKNTYGVVKLNGDVVFEGNEAFNTCRVHVNCGAGNIIVRNNVLYNTDDFNDNVKQNRNQSSDWGIIYCDHQYTDRDKALNNKSHRILLENNLLYGAYAYGGDARGIFIDDGRGDVSCEGNIVLNTQVYSIDARRSTTSAASVRNRYKNNILTSNYRLAAGDSVKGADIPVIDANILITSKSNVVQNAIVENDDTIIPNLAIDYSCCEGKIFVSPELFKIIKKSAAWRRINKHVVKN